MNRRERRAQQRAGHRPQLIPEPLRTEFAGIPKILNRQQCIEFVVMLAANLERLLNNRAQLPWITANIDKRTDGFSLHVQVIDPSDDTDTEPVTTPRP